MAGLAELAELAIPIAANIDRSYEKRFFHPIVCHVCKWLNNGNTIPCECGMLSYCSGEHLEIDRGRVLGSFGHGEICVVITSLIAMKEIRNYSLENNRWRQELRREGRPRRNKPWYKHHMTYLKVVQKNLSRNLEWHEKQMLLFARSCCICHEETDLSPCTTCFCVDFCAAHRNSKFPHDCEKQQEWLYTEMRSINVNPIPIYRPLHHFPDKQVDDIESFYERYMLPAKGVQWNVPDLVYSDYVSGPLTVYYGMRLANLFEDEPSAGDSYVIHIIEATEVDIDNVQSWEIFLHFFNKKTKLLIIMVGSEIEEELVKNLSGQLMTCVARCQTLDLTLNVEYHSKLYNEYASSTSYKAPDLLVGFHVKFSNGQTWKNFFASLKKSVCPLVLTVRSRVNGRRFTKRIQKALHENVKPVINRPNRFKACKLHKDYMNQRIFYQNQHLIIYTKLA